MFEIILLLVFIYSASLDVLYDNAIEIQIFCTNTFKNKLSTYSKIDFSDPLCCSTLGKCTKYETCEKMHRFHIFVNFALIYIFNLFMLN